MNSSDRIAVASLLTAAAALGVSIYACLTGAVEEKQTAQILKQDTTIQHLVRITSKLSDSYETQLRINAKLSESYDVQLQMDSALNHEVVDLRRLVGTSIRHFGLARDAFAASNADRRNLAYADSVDFRSGLDQLDWELWKLDNYVHEEHYDDVPFAPNFEKKWESVFEHARSLSQSRFLLTRPYQYMNFKSLDDYFHRYQMLFKKYDHRYLDVDEDIAKHSLGVRILTRFLKRNDSAASANMQAGINDNVKGAFLSAESVFKSKPR